MSGKASDQRSQIGSGELPLEGGSAGFVVPLPAEQALLGGGEISEVPRRQRLAFGDGQVDLDLVQPGGVDRGVDQDSSPSGLVHPPDGGGSVGGAAVADDPEHSAARGVWLLAHDLSDQPAKGAMPVVDSQRPKILARWISRAAM